MEDVKKMKYSWQVVRETMRLSPPIFGSFRKAVVDIDYEGFTIPKGWKVKHASYLLLLSIYLKSKLCFFFFSRNTNKITSWLFVECRYFGQRMELITILKFFKIQ